MILSREIIESVDKEDSAEFQNNDDTEARKKNFAQTIQRLGKNIQIDLKKSRQNSAIYKRYSKEQLLKYFKNPQHYEIEIREMSRYIYDISPTYKRLVMLFADILYFYYDVIPKEINCSEQIDIDQYESNYFTTINTVEKYNFTKLCREIINTLVRDGIYFGLYYETKDAFMINPLDIDEKYVHISNITSSGVILYSIDLEYFDKNKNSVLLQNDTKISEAFKRYASIKKNKISVKDIDEYRYYQPKNCVCLKADESGYGYSLPVFVGLLLTVFDIEDYKLLKKAKKEAENYSALNFKLNTDDRGVPYLDDSVWSKFYNMIVENTPEGVGVLLSPFESNIFEFKDSSAKASDAVMDTEDLFYVESGVSPLLFGSSKATSASAMKLAVKPNEKYSFYLLKKIESFFNWKLSQLRLKYYFKIEFLEISIFNKPEVVKDLKEAATYGIGGAKLKYATSLGITPSQVIGLSFIEDKILKVGTDIFTTPLKSSHTQSSSETSEEIGRPENEESEPLTDKGEESRERK